MFAAADIRYGAREGFEGVAHCRQQPLARRRQAEAPGAALEQLDAELFFQRAKLMADRRLGHMQLGGGLGEARMPGGCLEHTQRGQRGEAWRHD